MRHLHYLKIRNFKGFGDETHIELDRPAVLVGPNNCGKTTALQAIALWSQAVRDVVPQKGPGTAQGTYRDRPQPACRCGRAGAKRP